MSLSPLLTCPGVRSLLLAVALVGGVATAGAADRWIVGRTAHFEMYSSAGEDESRRMLTSLEQFRANFLGVLPLRGASEPRATVVLFDRDAAFRPYKPRYEGKPKEVAGYFRPGADEVAIALTSEVPGEEADPRQVIYHEYVHLLLHARGKEYPLWLDEGLAEVFSTFNVADGRVEYGTPRNEHVALLQNTPLLPLSRLFAVTHSSPEYNEEDRIGIFYAESWAFMHYLLFGENRANAAKLPAFVGRLTHGADAESSFREAFGSDFRAQEKALRRYLSGGGYYTRGRPAVAPKLEVTFRPAADVERDFALLNLRWRVHQDADAAAAALALLDRDPNRPRPHELLAAIAANLGDTTAAREHWRRAAELGSDNPWVYVQLLREQLDPYEGPMMLDVRVSAERIEPLRKWAAHALALSPENRDALEAAAVVEAIAEKMNIAVINRIQNPVSAMRDPARALLALGIVHWRGDDARGARNLVRLVASEPRAAATVRAAATALRYRLPAEERAPAPAGAPAAPPEDTRIALESGRVGDAAAYLDRLLAERGTTAPRLKLEPVVTRATGTHEPDAWDHADELRRKAMAGDANAMYELAVAHACGTGVEFSPALAARYLRQAIDRGHALAKSGLSAGKLEPELVTRYLRSDIPAAMNAALPPLEGELENRITEAASASERHAPVLLFHMPPRFPEELQRAGAPGRALIRFTIRADGHAEAIQAAPISDPASAAAATECLRAWRFIPTIRDHAPTDTLAEVSFTFEPASVAKSQ